MSLHGPQTCAASAETYIHSTHVSATWLTTPTADCIAHKAYYKDHSNDTAGNDANR